MGWGQGVHVGSVEHQRDDILAQDLEELLRDVVLAERVLKRQIKSEIVILKKHVLGIMPRKIWCHHMFLIIQS